MSPLKVLFLKGTVYVWEYFNCDVLKQEMCEINAVAANQTKQQLK